MTTTRTRRPDTATRRATRYAHQLSCRTNLDVGAYSLDGTEACWVVFATAPDQDPQPKMVITAAGSHAIAWTISKDTTNPYLTAEGYMQHVTGGKRLH
jgi:hypothetical protein